MLFFLTSLLFAHPASNIDFNYIKESQQVEIKVGHVVGDRISHYIKNITIYLNGKKIITQNAESQVDKKKQEVLYKIIDLKENDVIKVEVQCNKHGTRTEIFEI
jgi:desulfoferrodoxin (superoxide reductase-like protein)